MTHTRAQIRSLAKFEISQPIRILLSNGVRPRARPAGPW